MSRRILSVRLVFLLCAFCAHLCVSAEPAGVEKVTTVAPEDVASTTKTGAPNIHEMLRFPQVSLGHIHTQVIQVRDVPENARSIPTFMVSEVPYAEAKSNGDWQPWRVAKCKIEMKTPDGTVFYSQTVDFAKDWNGSHWGLITEEDRGGTIQILPSLPKSKEAGLYERHPTNYDIVVHVISASRRATDSFQFPETLLRIKNVER